MNQLKEMLEAYRNGERGLPTYDELAEVAEVQCELVEALRDMLSGWIYIRESHGDLYGVGWDRAQSKAVEALANARKPS